MPIHLTSDLDPDEAQEGLDSVEALVVTRGRRRARPIRGRVSERRTGNDSARAADRDRLEPLWPIEVGVGDPRLRIEDVEGERLLENEARARLEADGFTDAQILRWVEAFFAARHAGDVEDLVEWIQDQEHSRVPDAPIAAALPATGQ
jgi:hypothetical protein